MISIEQALQIIQDQPVSLAARSVPLQDSLHHYLAQQIIAPFDVPSFDNAAMDGYAVCGTTDSFDVVGEVAAGDTSRQALAEGQAMRIFTGGKVPDNTTAVVMQERTEQAGNRVTLHEEVQHGRHIRRKGSELLKGEEVFRPGHKTNPATLGLLASLGLAAVRVYAKPKVRIIATGNELIQPGAQRAEGQIYESNTHTLHAALHDFHFGCDSCRIISDDLDSIKVGVREAFEKCDVLLLSGGISVGAYDFVQQALEANGVQQLFYKVFQKPGKPLYFGRKDNKFAMALPGNPASSLTCFYLYVLPLLDKLSGGKGEKLPELELPLQEDYHFKFDRPTFLKAFVEKGKVTILDGQGSSMIHSMALGNALVFLDEAKVVKKGERVKVIGT